MRFLLLVPVFVFASAAWPCLFVSPSLLPQNIVIPSEGSVDVPLNTRFVASSTLTQLPEPFAATLVSENGTQALNASLSDKFLVLSPDEILAPQTLYTLVLEYNEFGRDVVFESTFSTGLSIDAEAPSGGELSEGIVEHSPSELYWNLCTNRPQRSTERWTLAVELRPGEDNIAVAGHRIIHTDAAGAQSVDALQLGSAPLTTSMRFIEPPTGVYTLETFDLAGNVHSEIAFAVTPDDIPGCACSESKAPFRSQRRSAPVAFALLALAFLLRGRKGPSVQTHPN